jgi:hypothetical protein
MDGEPGGPRRLQTTKQRGWQGPNERTMARFKWVTDKGGGLHKLMF